MLAGCSSPVVISQSRPCVALRVAMYTARSPVATLPWPGRCGINRPKRRPYLAAYLVFALTFYSHSIRLHFLEGPLLGQSLSLLAVASNPAISLADHPKLLFQSASVS